MLLETPLVEKLVEALRTLPGIGKRSAERIALHILTAPAVEAERLGSVIQEVRSRVCRCAQCRNLAIADPCPICADDRRDHATVCVVERPAGAMAIERGGVYKGLYHILHGAISPLDGIGPEQLGITHLIERINQYAIHEVILATNATVEGENTALYLSHILAPMGVRITRIAHGVPMGGGLEYADAATLSHAIQGRINL